MTQEDEDAIIGKSVRAHASAEKQVALLTEEARNIASVFERLYHAFGMNRPAGEIVQHGESLLRFLDHEKFDWSKLTAESLKDLVRGLRDALAELKITGEVKRKLGV